MGTSWRDRSETCPGEPSAPEISRAAFCTCRLSVSRLSPWNRVVGPDTLTAATHSPLLPKPAHHSGRLRCSVNDENMMLKLMLSLSFSLMFLSTECCRYAGKMSRVPFVTLTTT